MGCLSWQFFFFWCFNQKLVWRPFWWFFWNFLDLRVKRKKLSIFKLKNICNKTLHVFTVRNDFKCKSKRRELENEKVACNRIKTLLAFYWKTTVFVANRKNRKKCTKARSFLSYYSLVCNQRTELQLTVLFFRIYSLFLVL